MRHGDIRHVRRWQSVTYPDATDQSAFARKTAAFPSRLHPHHRPRSASSNAKVSMTKDYTTLPATHMRRNGRAVIDDGFALYLLIAAVGTRWPRVTHQRFSAAICSARWKQHILFTFTQQQPARTQQYRAINAGFVFTVFEMGRLLPAYSSLPDSASVQQCCRFRPISHR